MSVTVTNCNSKSTEYQMAREGVYTQLMLNSAGDRNNHFLALIISTWRVGCGVLPEWLGLSKASFYNLLDHNFPKFHFSDDFVCLTSFDKARMPEREDLVGLLMEGRTRIDENERWLAEITATACIGMDHLWQDMGLWSRKSLSELLHLNFPQLAKKNDRDMKWKKFLYKELCKKEGIYICRSPSCDVCDDYDNCFGSEEE